MTIVLNRETGVYRIKEPVSGKLYTELITMRCESLLTTDQDPVKCGRNLSNILTLLTSCERNGSRQTTDNEDMFMKRQYYL